MSKLRRRMLAGAALGLATLAIFGSATPPAGEAGQCCGVFPNYWSAAR